MNFSFNLLLVLIITGLITSEIFSQNNASGKLIVTFIVLEYNKGKVKVALCNSSKNYDDHKSPYIGKDIPIENNKAVIEFDELPYGEYAIKAFHDEDENDDLNTNILGMPVEDYGFSNNARGVFGPPSWESAKFNLRNDKKVIEIILK